MTTLRETHGAPTAARSSRLWDAAAWAAALPALATPVANPDLFWHLKTAERILIQRALPRDDSFSFTRLGEGWVDFEWLVQLVYYGAHALGGFAGLLALKVLMLAMAGAALAAVIELHRPGPALRRGLLLCWAALMLGRSELKPELFSVILFTAQLGFLEAVRLGRMAEPAPALLALGAAAYYAFWANLHPGFPAGLLLLAAYAAGGPRARAAGLALAALAGAAGALANPYGAGVYRVLAEHAIRSELLSRYILEWMPPMARNPYQWPVWLLLAALPAALAARIWHAGRPPRALALSAAAFWLPALWHARLAAYLIPVGLLVLAECWLAARPAIARPRIWAAAALAAYAGYIGRWAVPDLIPPRAFDGRFVPVAAADFIARELPQFRRRRPFNRWGWGGYLAWRFHPEISVFVDGRYLFHDLLDATARAYQDPHDWQRLLEAHGVEWALVEAEAQPVSLALRRDGAPPRPVTLPHLALYMPQGRWALVYRDAVARIYARRGAFPADWLARHELR